MTQMLQVNPKRKGGRKKNAAASTQKKGGRIKGAAKRAANRIGSSFKKFNLVNHLLIPAVMVAVGIVITRVIKKFVINKMTFLPNEITKNFAAAGAAAAIFFFGRKMVPNASMLIAGALALPVIDFAATAAPNMFAGLVYDGDVSLLNGADDIVLNNHNNSYTPALNGVEDEIMIG